MIPFPLAEGEAFGRGAWCTFNRLIDIGHVRPRLGLIVWQRHVAAAWRIPVQPTGVWDAQCTEAVLAVQAAHGIPASGVLDAETWEASWQNPGGGPAVERASVFDDGGSGEDPPRVRDDGD